jgi:tetratricopeptide (TPR) repeat protein
MSAEPLLDQGIAAARAGDKAAARQLLARVVQAEPKRVEGWWWLAQVLDDKAQRRYCLERARTLDPGYHGEVVAPPARPASTPASAARPAPKPGGAPAMPERTWPPPAGRPTPSDSWPPATPSERRVGVDAAAQSASAGPASSKAAGRRSGRMVALAVMGGIVLAGLILIAMLALVLGPRRQSTGPAVFATLPPAWTDTPPPAGTATATPAPTMPPPTPDLLAGNELAAQALALMEEGKHDEAIPLWDEILYQDPSNHAAYYQRAVSNLEASTGETILQIYQLRALEAIADADQAIALSDGFSGDYHEARAVAFEKLAAIAENRVDQARLFGVALENSLRADSLPRTSPFAGRSAAIYMMFTGQCEQGLELARRLDAERGAPDAAPSVALSYILGGLSQCVGDYQASIDHLSNAIERDRQCLYLYLRSESRYLQGNLDQARGELNGIISACPSFAGYRYWLRALMSQEQGDTEGALKDLQTGAMNTWGRGGLYAYVQSLIALERGDRAQAVELLKHAERTSEWASRPFIERFQAELAALGEQPESPTPDPYPVATPLAPLPDGHPTAVPLRYIWLTDGTGPLELAPGQTIDLYFVPPKGFTFHNVRSLAVHLLSSQSGPVSVEVNLYRSRDRRWERIEVEWGENKLKEPEPYVNTSGDVLLRLRATGPEVLVLSDIGLSMTVQEMSSNFVTYSYRDE